MRISLVLAVLLGGVVGPAVAETAAYATVYDSCDMPRCADARAAHDEWAGYGYPTTRGWHPWSGGQSNFAGGQFFNYEGQLPAGATYYEYDVYPRAEGASRDAYRIVVNTSTDTTWFSPNHYTDFYRLT
ncbi:ribonuclease domain-containing protein [Luedemannella flava]|uniref:Ribonuclease domain-containing protein n=1 Tax=Luedemannella flava TaxID=349316 RepID=A0ABN2MQ31_9ACTN